MTALFRSYRRRPTPAEMALQLAQDTIADHRAHLAEIAAMEAAGEQRVVTEADRARVQERMRTLGALLQGRHRAAILPLVLEAFPDLTELGGEDSGESGQEEATDQADA